MNIAMVHSTLPSDWRTKEGGVTYFVHELANRLVERDHKVTVFTFDKRPPDAKYTVRTVSSAHWLHTNKLLRYYALPFVFSRVNFQGFEIVHAHGDDWLLRTNGVPHIRTFHGAALAEAKNGTSCKRRLNQQLIYQTEKLTAQRSAASVVISQDTLDYFPEATFIIPCGVDIQAFRSPNSTKCQYPSILFVGALEGRKRGSLLVELFRTRIQPTIPEAQLWLVGEKNIEGKGIYNMGKVSQIELIELYQKAWVFCLPSTYEGFGIPYIEAMAAGTPVVASPNPGSIEVLDGGKYGRICQDGELGTTLIDLLKNQEARQNLVELGWERSQKYDWSKVLAMYETLYSKLIKKNRHTSSELFERV